MEKSVMACLIAVISEGMICTLLDVGSNLHENSFIFFHSYIAL